MFHTIKLVGCQTGDVGNPHRLCRAQHNRRGFVTAAFAKGAPLTSVMKQGRWRDIKTVMGYFEESQRFEDNAVDILIKK